MRNSVLVLNRKQQKLYDLFLSGLKNERYSISLPPFSDTNEAFDILKLVIGDYPEFFYYDNCNVSMLGNQMHIKKLYGKIEQIGKINRFNEESKRIALSIIKPEMNAAQKVLAVHNYLAKNVRYNSSLQFSNYSNELHTAYGAIVNKVAVCEGISCAFSHLLHLCGVNCSIINGKTDKYDNDGHSWNIVNIGKDFFHVDVTWDIESNGDSKGNCFDYFGLTDADLGNRIWKNYYPICDCNKYNYFVLSNSIAENDSQLCKIALKQLKSSNHIYLKYNYLNNKDELQVSNYIFEQLQNNLEIRSYFFGRYYSRVNIDQKIVLIEAC